MAMISNGQKNSELSLTIEVLSVLYPDGGMITYGPVSFSGPVVHAEVTYRVNNINYLRVRLVTPRHCLLTFPYTIAAEMYELEKPVIAFGMDSPEFQMWVQKAHVENEEDPPEEAFYTLDAVIDTGALPGGQMITFDGLQIHFSGVRGYELLAFAQTLAEEVKSASREEV